MHHIMKARMARLVAEGVTSGGAASQVEVKRGIDILAGTDMVPGLSNFIGQKMAIVQLQMAVQSAKVRGVSLGHVGLFSSQPGIGKTTLAKLVAVELGSGFVECSGKIKLADARMMLAAMQDGDVLFIDEAHSLGKSADWILPLMTDKVLLTPSGPEKVPDITVIMATTHPSKMADALISRCAIKPKLTGYDADEAAQIVEQLSARMGVLEVATDHEAITRIAEAANHNPRTMRSILATVRDMITLGKGLDLDFALKLLGITADGLEETAQNYLIALLSAPNYTASASTIGAITGEKENLAMVETELIARGLVVITAKGRQLSKEGCWRTRALLSEI